MKVLFIGDIVGRPGRRAVAEILPAIVGEQAIDLVVANCENAAGGFGVTHEIVEELLSFKIDVLTSGNHIWDKKETGDFIDEYPNLLRPANFPPGVKGSGAVIVSTPAGDCVAVLNLMGRVFMAPADCPFRTADRELENLRSKTKAVIVDFHAEATSEKQALGWYLKDRASAVIGTHTHVQTADEKLLSGTAYITDAGMTGPHESIIGNVKEDVLKRFLTGMPSRFEVAKRDVHLQGVIIDIDPATGNARHITRVDAKLNR